MSANIYRVLRDFKDYWFKGQITRSGLSVLSNIAVWVVGFGLSFGLYALS